MTIPPAPVPTFLFYLHRHVSKHQNMDRTNLLQLPLPDLDLCYVHGGTFTMGDNKSEDDEEKPEHPVKLSSFYIGKYQVTQRLWQAVMHNNPARSKGEKRPVEQVSWDDAQDFIKKLDAKKELKDYFNGLGLAGAEFRLPTEAEWEYAARGGKYAQGYGYCGSDKLNQVGWNRDNSNTETHEVGLLLANELGLYDVSGNVWEWCEDWYGEEYYEKCQQQGIVENPVNREKGVNRVLRGGSYFYFDFDCRPAYRYRNRPGNRDDYCGFRLLLSLQSSE